MLQRWGDPTANHRPSVTSTGCLGQGRWRVGLLRGVCEGGSTCVPAHDFGYALLHVVWGCCVSLLSLRVGEGDAKTEPAGRRLPSRSEEMEQVPVLPAGEKGQPCGRGHVRAKHPERSKAGMGLDSLG